MMRHPQEASSLQSHVRSLRYAGATTTCRTTAEILESMLKEAQASLQDHDATSEDV